jgi:hypothetical protein
LNRLLVNFVYRYNISWRFENFMHFSLNVRILKSLTLFNFYLLTEMLLMNFVFNFNSIVIYNPTFYGNLLMFKLSNLALVRFLNYRLYNYNVTTSWPSSALSFKYFRKAKLSVSPGLLGFKMACLGRFSRRQRVQWVYLRDFKLPLTFISAKVDYNFIVIPLANSATSIKVWLYKSEEQPNFYLKVL